MVLTERQKRELLFAKRCGAVSDIGEESLYLELLKINEEDRKVCYGKTDFNEISFIRYKLAKLRMDFVFGKWKYEYRNIEDAEIETFFTNNKEMFLKEGGDYFPMEEIRPVIIKRLREREYEEAINAILC